MTGGLAVSHIWIAACVAQTLLCFIASLSCHFAGDEVASAVIGGAGSVLLGLVAVAVAVAEKEDSP